MKEIIYVLEGGTINRGFTFYVALNAKCQVEAFRESLSYLRKKESDFGDPWKKKGRLDMSKWRVMRYEAKRINTKRSAVSFLQGDL